MWMRNNKMLIQPIIEISILANELSKGSLNFKNHYKNDDEIGDLFTSFDNMRDTIKSIITDINKLVEFKDKENITRILFFDEKDHNVVFSLANNLNIKAVEDNIFNDNWQINLLELANNLNKQKYYLNKKYIFYTTVLIIIWLVNI